MDHACLCGCNPTGEAQPTLTARNSSKPMGSNAHLRRLQPGRSGLLPHLLLPVPGSFAQAPQIRHLVSFPTQRYLQLHVHSSPPSILLFSSSARPGFCSPLRSRASMMLVMSWHSLRPCANPWLTGPIPFVNTRTMFCASRQDHLIRIDAGNLITNAFVLSLGGLLALSCFCYHGPSSWDRGRMLDT